MDLFKERLKIAFVSTVEGIYVTIIALFWTGVIIGVILFEALPYIIVGGLLVFFVAVIVRFLVIGIYWLFVEPFRKTKGGK